MFAAAVRGMEPDIGLLTGASDCARHGTPLALMRCRSCPEVVQGRRRMTPRSRGRIVANSTSRRCAMAVARRFTWHLGEMFLAMVVGIGRTGCRP